MSRAFTKEADGLDFVEDLPERPVSAHPNLVTPRGLRLIDDEIAGLRHALAEATGEGDRTAIARCSRDLRYWTARRASAQLAEAKPDSDTVAFGMTVEIERDDGRRQALRIVGEDEADPSAGLISWISPIAQAVLGREEGEVVAVAGGEVEIVSFTAEHDTE